METENDDPFFFACLKAYPGYGISLMKGVFGFKFL